MRLAALVATLSAFLVAPAAAKAASGPAEAAEVLELLHSGRFVDAERRALALVEADPRDPAASFLHAFAGWWRLLYDDKNDEIARALAVRLEAAEEVATAAGDGRSAGVDNRVWNGYSRILLAELHASRKEVLAAIREAKNGHRLLSAALAAAPESPEPCFGLGTYNYYADRMPALVKGLRFLLGMPSGDRDTGLQQLRTAADHSTLFALESRLLLATILASKHERDYAAAAREAATARAKSGDSVVVLDAAARLDLALGRIDDAVAALEEAIRRGTASPGADASVIAALRLQRARAEFARFRPDLALELAQRLLERETSIPARVANDARTLADTSARLIGQPPLTGLKGWKGLRKETWESLRGALETERTNGVEESVAALDSLRHSDPREPAVDLFYGRALLAAGRPGDAIAPLERAAKSTALPEPWIGSAHLLAGEALDATGQRKKAIDHYRIAAKTPPLVESASPHLYQRVAYRAPARSSTAERPKPQGKPDGAR